MVRLLHLAGYTRVFATASSKHHDYLRALGATDLFDYSSPTLVDDINKALGGPEKITLAVDCISAEKTLSILAKIVSPTGRVALLVPVKKGSTLNNGEEDNLFLDLPLAENVNPFQKDTNIIGVRTFLYQQVRRNLPPSLVDTPHPNVESKPHKDEFLKENLMPVVLPDLLQKGLVQPTRFRVMDQGSLQERVEQALDLFRNNKVSGEKLVIKIN